MDNFLLNPCQITTDGSLGQAINLSGPDYQMSADLGQQHGGNLFHSFKEETPFFIFLFLQTI